ncbi:hypothetical protein P7C73_g1220, partial [Tremellales sp. Uapishka_1]
MPISEPILISDGEDDGISFVTAIKVTRTSRTVPIFVDDSESEDERLPDIADLLTGSLVTPLKSVETIDRKGKGKARSTTVTTITKDQYVSLSRSPTPDFDRDMMDFAIASVSQPVAKRKSTSADPESQSKKKKSASAAKMTKEEREASKESEKKQKQLEKDTIKAAKEAEKSYQKKVAEVNKLRTSKNDAVREIHLYLSHDLSLPSSPIAGALPEIESKLKGNLSELHILSDEDSPYPGIIKFKRHVQARWSSSEKRFIPLPSPHWRWESTVVIVVPADEIVDKVAGGNDLLSKWSSDVRLATGLSRKDQVFIMIKGLQKYYSKTKSLANKEYTAQARAGLSGTSISSQSSLTVRPSKGTIEMELVKLQVAEGCFLIHVEKTEDVEDWIWNLSADIAIRPYKLITKSHLAFCPQDGIKKGSGPIDAFELMLQEVHGITPSAAAGIVREYPSFKHLMEAFERAERKGLERAEEMLKDCEIRNLKNGVANGRLLNKALAKRVYHVFRGEDSLALA